MLEELKQRVYEANMQLPVHGLVTFTWGNVSEIDRETGYFAIKPSGVPYEKLKPEDMVIMDLNGNKIEGKYNPSSDTLVLCNKLGTGRKRHPMLRYHSCRLYLWRSPMSQMSYKRRN